MGLREYYIHNESSPLKTRRSDQQILALHEFSCNPLFWSYRDPRYMTRNFVHIAAGSRQRFLAENNDPTNADSIDVCSICLTYLGTENGINHDSACFEVYVSKNQHVIPWWVLMTLQLMALTPQSLGAHLHSMWRNNSVPTRVLKGPSFILFCSTFKRFWEWVKQSKPHFMGSKNNDYTLFFPENKTLIQWPFFSAKFTSLAWRSPWTTIRKIDGPGKNCEELEKCRPRRQSNV